MSMLQKGSPMSKKEIHLLLDLVSKKPIIISKDSKASSNKLKRRAWAEIAAEFNAKNDRFRPRDQLNLRWANLKKTCRKKIKLNGGKLHIPDRDGVMDRVLNLMESSCTGFEMTDMACNEVSDGESYKIDENDLNMAAEYNYLSTVQARKENGLKERNLAMARYFEKKAEKVDIEIKLLKLQLLSKKRKVIEDIDI